MTTLNEALAEFARDNAVKADAIELGYAAHRLNLRMDGGADEIVVRILEYFRAHSIGHYRYQGTLMFEITGDLFVV